MEQISFSNLWIGEVLNGISLYIIEHYKSFEAFSTIYQDKKDLIKGIEEWFYLELTEMLDEDEMSLETLDKVINQFVENNIEEVTTIIKKLYVLNKKCYVE